MPGPHPTDRSLAALIDGRFDTDMAHDVRSHVLNCAHCQLRVGSAETSAGASEGLQETEAIPVRLFDEVRDQLPSKGDIWRLAWDDTVLLGVVWRVDSDLIAVLPVVDLADTDEWSAVLTGDETGGLGEIAVAVALETSVPWSVLDARIVHLTEIEPLTLLRTGYRTGASADGTLRGQPILSPLDDRLVDLDELAQRLSVLANAVWLPAAGEASALELTYDLLQEAGLPANRALAISKRGSAPTDNEAARIETATGVRPPSPPIADALKKKIDSPFRKPKIRARARANRRSEAQERLSLAREAEPAASAARGTFGRPLDYDDILDRLLGD